MSVIRDADCLADTPVLYGRADGPMYGYYITKSEGTIMFTNQELIGLWSNDKKRRAFAQEYQAWGVWFTQPELELTFYKFDLPGGHRLIAMEYRKTPYGGAATSYKRYLQRGEHFYPYPTCDSEISEYLKQRKAELLKGEKEDAK